VIGAAADDARSPALPCAAVSETAGADDEIHAPAWVEVIPVAASIGLLTFGGVGLLLAIAGWYGPVITVIIATPVFVVLLMTSRRRGATMPLGRVDRWCAWLAIAFAAAFVLFAGTAPSQHVYVDRDPAAYVNIAVWISHHGSLEVPAEMHEPFIDAPGVFFEAPAVYDNGDGTLHFQFNHLTSVAEALALDLGGTRLLFRLPAIVAGAGILAIYSIAVRCTRRPVLALVAALALGTSMPVLATGRDVYSEPLAMLLIWTGALLLIRAWSGRQRSDLVIGSLVLGGASMARFDAIVYVALAIAVMTIAVAWRQHAQTHSPCTPVLFTFRNVDVATMAAIVPVGLMALDLMLRSRQYAEHQRREVYGAFALLLVVIAICVIARLWPELARRVVRGVSGKRSLAVGTAVFVAMAGVALWLLRPLVQTARGRQAQYLVGDLQARAGQTVDHARRYLELSASWIAWYLGPLGLALGIAGLALACYRTLLGRATRTVAVVAGFCLLSGALLLWDPRVSPDQIWGARRYVPVLLPSVCMLAAFALSVLYGRSRWRQLTVSGAAALLVIQTAAVTWPVSRQREQYSFANAVVEACGIIDGRAVLAIGPESSIRIPQTLRSWCDVPVASANNEMSTDDLARLAVAWEERGRGLALATVEPAALDTWQVQLGAVAQTAVATNTRQSEKTLTRAPSSYWTESIRFTIADVPTTELPP
jgi:hypothetical protein